MTSGLDDNIKRKKNKKLDMIWSVELGTEVTMYFS
jgi:hypothetical protein